MEKHGKGAYTLIGEGTIIEGTIIVPHPIRIDGTLRGSLETVEMLTVGVTGTVEANIIAKSAMIGGKMVGNITVEDRVELEAHSSLEGDLKAREIIISEGAFFNGNCFMGTREKKK
jgi:cytoskeletal protein CcmA (bactofilin family)